MARMALHLAWAARTAKAPVKTVTTVVALKTAAAPVKTVPVARAA